MKTCLSFQEFHIENGYIRIVPNEGEIRLYFMTDDIVRIRASFDQKFDEASYLLTMTGWEDALDSFLGQERQRISLQQPTITEQQNKITFSTKTIDLVLEKQPLAFKMYDKAGDLLYADIPGKAFQQDHLKRIYHYNLMKPNECYYGFGEKTGAINKMEQYMRFSPKDNLGYNPQTGDPMYKHIPFYLRLDPQTKKSMGVFYHNTYESALSMGAEISGYWPRYSYFVADGGDIDVFLIAGPKIKSVIQRYTDLTGKTVMQPKYSLGYIGSTMYYSELPHHCDEEILGYVDQVRKHDIPIDAFMLSSGYTSGADHKRYVFTWQKDKFPDPAAFFARMKEKGVEVCANVKPGILDTHPDFDHIEQADCLVKTPDGSSTQPVRWWGGMGAYFDFTNQKARTLWTNYLKEQLMEQGTVAIWNDNCEYDGIDDREALFEFEGATATHGALKCVQATLMSQLSHEAAKQYDSNIRPFVVCRAGSAGIQRYAQTWAGDNRTSFASLKYNIATVLGLGLSGVANAGSDIGGFHGPAPNAELFVRWVQSGVFFPRFSIHSCNNDNTVTEPWMYGNYTQYIREAIKLRYTFIPYWYALLREANVEGNPMIRPLFYEFQQDEACYDEGVNFMFGSYILVANVVDEGATEKQLYLPRGCDWYDYYTRQCYAGGQTITIPVEIGSIPLFIREGAIIPTTKGIQSINQQDIDFLQLTIMPKTPSTFTLYEDDGCSTAYLGGDYLSTDVCITPGERITISFSATGSYQTKVKTVLLDVTNKEKGPYWVTVDGDILTQYLHRDKWETASAGFYYSHTLKSVLVKYPQRQGNYDVVVSFEAFDLIGM